MNLEAPKDAKRRRIIESLRLFLEAKQSVDTPMSSVLDLSNHAWERLREETVRVGWLKPGGTTAFLRRKWSAFNSAAQARIRAKISLAKANGGAIHLDEIETLILRLNNCDPAQFQVGNLQSTGPREPSPRPIASEALEAPIGVQPTTSNASIQTSNENVVEVLPRRITRRSSRAIGGS